MAISTSLLRSRLLRSARNDRSKYMWQSTRDRLSMNLEKTLSVIENDKKYRDLVGLIEEGGGATVSVGFAARPYLLAVLFRSTARPMLIITSSTEKARNMVEDLRAYSVEAELFPEVETMPYDSLSPSAESVGRRLAVLDKMAAGLSRVWVTPITSALRVVMPASANLHHPLSLRVGDEADLYDLAGQLAKMGYIRTPLVEGHGQFSMRGDIIDI